MRCTAFLLVLVVCSTTIAQAPPNDPAKLTLDRIFGSDEFQSDRTPAVKWLKGGGYTVTQRSKTHKGSDDIVEIDRAGSSRVLVAASDLMPPNAKSPLAIQSYEFSQDQDLVLIYTNTEKVWRQHTRGDYWIFSRSTNKLRKLGGHFEASSLMFAKISPDGTHIGYVHANNIYVEPVTGGPPVALTRDGSLDRINGTFDWVYEEEFGCRDGWRWSPDGQQIAYWQLNSEGVPKFTLVDNTTKKYPVLKSFSYPKTGERNSACRIGIVATSGGETKWLDMPGDSRTEYYLPRMEWAGNSQELVIQRINRLQNALTVILADVATGQQKPLLTERDATWVDIDDDSLDWVDDGKKFTWISERNGWRHLYLAARDGTKISRMTSGEFDVIRVVYVDKMAGYIYFIASPKNATQRYLYRFVIAEQKSERITPAKMEGWNDYQISPNGSQCMHTHSAFGTPPSAEIISLPDHATIRTLTTNEKLVNALSALAPSPVEFFRVEIQDGVQLDGWMIKPPHFDSTKKYPLLFHVYGEPAGQAVTDRWGGNQYLWHRFLAQEGYIVACVDNRGTPAPRGRDWRKAAYRRVGTLASEEQSAAARVLLKRPYLDGSRVGVWGWSGGGSMTLNLLFRYPELYQTGMAVAPVPDMHLYDTIYQERYMGLPQDNDADYVKGSPITHAAGLKGNLLLVHGTGDDNCHYQGVEILTNKLIELNKPFSLMAYPNRSHSINEGKNTTRHLYGLLTRYLREHLPAEAR